MPNHASEPPLLRPSLGDTIAGRYLLEELIGEGGYAEVFRAQHKYLKTTVALKILAAGKHDEVENMREFLLVQSLWSSQETRAQRLLESQPNNGAGQTPSTHD